MVMAEFPDDVISAILLLLPIKSLMRFKCVDKSLCALIHNTYFRDQRLSLRPDATHLLISYKYNQTIFTAATNGGAPHPILPNILEHGPFNLSSCHGLISMHPRDEPKTNTFVYNPNTRETVTIPFNANAFKDCMSVRSYIGFEPVSNRYKLMILSLQEHKYSYSSRHCEIITLGGTKNNWRQVDTNEAPPDALVYGHSSICLNGALHWRTFERQLIVVFDLKSNKFGTIHGPEGIQESKWYTYKLCQVHGRLILVESKICGPEASLELWTLQDHYNGVWVKGSFNFCVPQDLVSTATITDTYVRVVGGSNNDEILFSLGLDQVFAYDMKSKKGRTISVGGKRTIPILKDFMLYTESMRCY